MSKCKHERFIPSLLIERTLFFYNIVLSNQFNITKKYKKKCINLLVEIQTYFENIKFQNYDTKDINYQYKQYSILMNKLDYLMKSFDKIDESENMIEEALRSKYDILLKLESLIKTNIKETKINFKDLNDLKKESISNFQLERKLVDTVLLINKIQDDFPELEEIKDYRELLNDIRVMDERINAAKKYYNKYTSKSNELVRKFPSNLIAKFHNITVRNFFDNKDMNDDIIDDFKL